MALPEESDEEWARIADAVNVFEAQYNAARNLASPGDGLAPSLNLSHSAAPSNLAGSPAYHEPTERSTVSRDALCQPSRSRATPSQPINPSADYAQPKSGSRPPSALTYQPSSSSRMLPESIIPSHSRADDTWGIQPPAPYDVRAVTTETVPVTGSKAIFTSDALKTAKNSGPGLAEEDPFALLLCQKETELYNLRQEMKGEQSNFRNRIRSLQKELHDARSTPTASSALTSCSTDKITQLAEEKLRLQKELDEARTNLRTQSEALQFAQQELGSLRDRERKHLAALCVRTAPAFDDASLPLPVVPALTQPGDVVEGTQLPDVTTQATASQAAATQVLDADGAAPRPTSRRRRKPNSARSSSGTGAYFSQSAPHVTELTAQPVTSGRKRDRNDFGGEINNTLAEENRRIDGAETESNFDPSRNTFSEEVHYGWPINFDTDTWCNQSLREHLFRAGLGERIMNLIQRARSEGLGKKILSGLSGEGDWVGALDALTSIISKNRSVANTALIAVDVLLTFDGECRRHAAMTADDENGLVATCMTALETATRYVDFKSAELCLKVLHGAVGGVWENHGDGAEVVEAMTGKVCTGILRSENWMKWLSRNGGIRERVDALNKLEEGKGCEVAAWQLLEEVCGLAVESQNQVQDSEWSAVEKAYGEAAELLEKGRNEDTIELAIGMMAHAAVHAPYLVTDFGGAEGLCGTLGRAIWWLQRDDEIDRDGADEEELPEFDEEHGRDGHIDWRDVERSRIVGIVRACVGTLLLTGAGMGGKLGLSPCGRIIGMTSLAVLGWPRPGWAGTPQGISDDTRFRDECRRAWKVVAQCGQHDTHTAAQNAQT